MASGTNLEKISKSVQDSLSKVESQYSLMGLHYSAPKCKAMLVTSKQKTSNPTLSLNGMDLEYVK